ncbi:hypothetical protein ACHAPQ_002118 [Fusarium lateritium]
MTLTPAVPPDPSVPVWSRFISTFEASEYSGWQDESIGHAKHVINCYDDGNIIGEGLVLCIEKNDYIYTGGPGCFWAQFLHANPRQKTFDIELEDWTQQMFLLQVQGPRSVPILDEMTQEDGGIRDLKFMHAKKLTIRGHKCWCLRQGISGELGYELWGNMSDATEVYKSVLEYI